MRRWLLKQWRRFTLGRTALPITSGPRLPYHCTGTWAAIASALKEAAETSLSAGVPYEVVERRATDLAPGSVRIVLEVCE